MIWTCDMSLQFAHRWWRAGVECLLILALLTLGWSGTLLAQEKGDKEKPKPAAKAPAKKEAPKKETPKETDKAEAKTELRKTLEGKWAIVLSQGGAEIPLWLVEFTPEGDKFTGKLLESNERMLGGASTLKEAKVDGAKISLTIEGAIDFSWNGTFADGMALGELSVRTQILPVALKATDVANLRNPRPTPDQAMPDLRKAIESEEFADIEKFIDTHPKSALSLMAIEKMLQMLPNEKLDQAGIEKFGEKAVAISGAWGPNLATEMQLKLGTTLAEADLFPELALAHLTAVEKSSAGAALKTSARTERAKLYIKTDRREDGLKLVQEILAASPFEAELIYILARDAEKQMKIDEAIGYYAELVAVPQLEQMVARSIGQVERSKLPSAALSRLWKEKHDGKTEGMDEFLMSIYERKTHVAKEKMPARKPEQGNRIALFELFTGASCPPCVAADLATANVEAAFDKSEAIVLRYHQHIPRPDPLANEESKARFESYEGRGTPTLILNGAPLQGAGGGIDSFKDNFDSYVTEMAASLKASTMITLQLSAENKEGKLEISVKAEGEEFSKSMRLRLALAESKFNYPAPNGIRVHEMVVRTMPGGAAGIKPVDGKLSYTGTVDLEALRTSLVKELKDLEKQLSSEDGKFKFDSKPLDFAAFALVAFVQDEKTGEILQAGSIPAEGLKTKFVEAEEKPAAKEKDGDKKEDAEEKPAPKKGEEKKESKKE